MKALTCNVAATVYHCNIPLTLLQYRRLMDLERWEQDSHTRGSIWDAVKKAGAETYECNGHFGAYVHFSAEDPAVQGRMLEVITRLLATPMRQLKKELREELGAKRWAP